MTGATPRRRSDLMGGPGEPSDVMTASGRPAGCNLGVFGVLDEPFDLMAVGQEPVWTDAGIMTGRDDN